MSITAKAKHCQLQLLWQVVQLTNGDVQLILLTLALSHLKYMQSYRKNNVTLVDQLKQTQMQHRRKCPCKNVNVGYIVQRKYGSRPIVLMHIYRKFVMLFVESEFIENGLCINEPTCYIVQFTHGVFCCCLRYARLAVAYVGSTSFLHGETVQRLACHSKT